MAISEQDLRAMIRDAIAHHGAVREPQAVLMAPEPDLSPAHCSHGIFAAVPAGDGECIIEPAVRCNHCGYCKSLGH
jgi:hypothetical protein